MVDQLVKTRPANGVRDDVWTLHLHGLWQGEPDHVWQIDRSGRRADPAVEIEASVTVRCSLITTTTKRVVDGDWTAKGGLQSLWARKAHELCNSNK